MENIINSIKKSLEVENYYSALFVALTLPDICSSLEFGKSDSSRYSTWFENNLKEYTGFLSGNDYYALRCSTLHQAIDDIQEQSKKDILEHFVFLTSGGHLSLFKDCNINGVNTSFLRLNVNNFCNDLCSATEKWLNLQNSNPDIQKRIKNTLEIHEPGYIHMGVIKFC